MGSERRVFGGPPRPQLRRVFTRVSLSLCLLHFFGCIALADSGSGKPHEVGDARVAAPRVSSTHEGADTREADAADVPIKVAAAVFIFLCAILGALPAFLLLRRQQQQQQHGDPPLLTRGSSCNVVPSCCSSNYGAAASACCFGASPFYVRAATVYTAGVVAAVALLHLLPAADRRLSHALETLKSQGGPRWSAEYSAASLCCLVGLLLSAALEAVVEQQQTNCSEEEGPSSAAEASSSSKERQRLSAISPVQLEAAAAGDRDNCLSAVQVPLHWEVQRDAAAQESRRGCCCVTDAACRGRPYDMELCSAPQAPTGAGPQTYSAAALQSRRCCVSTTCCGCSTSSSSRDNCRMGRGSLAAAVALPAADACTSTNSNGEAETRVLSCPYTLMDEGAVGSAHPQPRKQLTRGGSLQGGRRLPSCRGGSQEGSIFVGGLLMTGLSIHSVMEGLTLGAAPNPKTIALAILFHKTLEAFAVGSSLLHVRVTLRSYILQMLFYALTAPLGVAGGIFLQHYVDASPPSNGAGGAGSSPYLQLIPGFLIGLGAGAFLHVGLLEILASELQRCRREKRGDMLPMIGLTAVGALCMAFL